MSSRIILTNAGCVPAVAARTIVMPEFFGDVLRFVIEIVNDFHVIRDETDRRHNDVLNPFRVHLPQSNP